MTSISCLISFALIWILFFWCWRDYRLNRFRQELFSLRDELFDIARSGDIAFTHPAYQVLRTTINGTIQFGHKFGIVDLLACLTISVPEILQKESVRSKFSEQCSELDDKTKTRMQNIYDRMHVCIVEQVILTSFALMSAVALFAGLILLNSVKSAVMRQLHRLIHSPRVAHALAQLDNAALMRAS